jgi:enamine deaminase RidA (YjgF/YER057c/UK114 family)
MEKDDENNAQHALFGISTATRIDASICPGWPGSRGSIETKKHHAPSRSSADCQLRKCCSGWQLLFLAGNTSGPRWQPNGKVGNLTVEQGYAAARQAGLIMLAKVRGALGSLDRVKRIVKVLGMVNSAEGFGDQPAVINGFSDLMVEVFGESVGKHARSAVGMGGLPGNAPVEVEMIIEVE